MLNHMCAHMEACYTHVFLFNHMISKHLRLEICTCETLVPHVNVPKPHKHVILRKLHSQNKVKKTFPHLNCAHFSHAQGQIVKASTFG